MQQPSRVRYLGRASLTLGPSIIVDAYCVGLSYSEFEAGLYRLSFA